MDKEFYIIDALSIVDYLDGESVPCEIAVVSCSIRNGIMGYYHFFPDPGPLRFVLGTYFTFTLLNNPTFEKLSMGAFDHIVITPQ